ncbi:MAG: PTS sugar transporter subunit IIA [Gemmatimonadaceae bacterium]
MVSTPAEIRLLTALLPPERIRVPLGSHSRHAVLRELVEIALPDADPATVDDVFQSVLSRESIASTAMGDGLAVPHGRSGAIGEFRMAAGLAESVDDYVAPDGVPVRACFLLLTPPADGGAHLRVLARLARLMHKDELRSALLAATDAEGFSAVLRRSEAP